MSGFQVKDSGAREQFASGMVRDTTAGKVDYSLLLDGPMFERWAALLEAGAVKYARRNWMQANGEAELERFRSSAFRHFLQWMRGDVDEDHAAAVFFNLNGAEYVKAQIEQPAVPVDTSAAINRKCYEAAFPLQRRGLGLLGAGKAASSLGVVVTERQLEPVAKDQASELAELVRDERGTAHYVPARKMGA